MESFGLSQSRDAAVRLHPRLSQVDFDKTRRRYPHMRKRVTRTEAERFFNVSLGLLARPI